MSFISEKQNVDGTYGNERIAKAVSVFRDNRAASAYVVHGSGSGVTIQQARHKLAAFRLSAIMANATAGKPGVIQLTDKQSRLEENPRIA
jgi:hypothetical protein